jgi:hypothetical protein
MLEYKLLKITGNNQCLYNQCLYRGIVRVFKICIVSFSVIRYNWGCGDT